MPHASTYKCVQHHKKNQKYRLNHKKYIHADTSKPCNKHKHRHRHKSKHRHKRERIHNHKHRNNHKVRAVALPLQEQTLKSFLRTIVANEAPPAAKL